MPSRMSPSWLIVTFGRALSEQADQERRHLGAGDRVVRPEPAARGDDPQRRRAG